jgi:threonine dehydratase
MRLPVVMEDVRAAAIRIADHVVETPVVSSPSLSAIAGAPVYLKLEHRQTTGSFKLRGAMNAILSLSEEERSRGVVTVSTGNHGRALAHAARACGVSCVVCLSRLVPQNKVDGVKAAGAEVHIGGRSQDEAEAAARKLVDKEGLSWIPPFDHLAVVAGQGTLGLEIMEAVPNVRKIVVPLSGGGLIAGIALAAKTLRPGVGIVGVATQQCPAMAESLRAGGPVLVEEKPSLADSLGGGIGLDNAVTFPMVQALVDDVVRLDEETIATGVFHAYAAEQEIIEGAAATPIAALLSGVVKAEGPTVLLLTGRNIDMALHKAVICGTWRERFRIAEVE